MFLKCMEQTLVHYRFRKNQVPSFYLFLILVGCEWLLNCPILQCSWAYGHWCPAVISYLRSPWGDGAYFSLSFLLHLRDKRSEMVSYYRSPASSLTCSPSSRLLVLLTMLKPSAGTTFRQSEGRYEAAELSWARRRTKWPRNLGQLRSHRSSQY